MLSVTSADAVAAFGSGTSPANAIAVPDESSANENGEIEIEDIDLDKMLDVNSAIAVEKEIAADTMGTVFAATRMAFLPYVEQCTLELVGLLPHYYEGIRKSATDSLLEIIRTFYELSGPVEWAPGAHPQPLHENVKSLINHSLPPLIDMVQSEDNKYVAPIFYSFLVSIFTT